MANESPDSSEAAAAATAPLEEQRKLFAQADPPVEDGSHWYLVSNKWYRQWSALVGGPSFVPPSEPLGVIDNTPLLDADGELKPHLMEMTDYTLVPEDKYAKLKQWYGSTHDVLRYGVERQLARGKTVTVEVYLLEVEAFVKENPTDRRKLRVSHASTVGQLKTLVCTTFGVPDDADARLLDGELGMAYDEKRRLYDIAFIRSVALQRRGPDGNWPSASSLLGSTTSSYSGGSLDASVPVSPMDTSVVPSSPRPKRTPGTMGLQNLGNTCFMNSALQCLMHAPPLTDFFLDDSFKQQINRDNPIGKDGEVAENYANLVRASFSGEYSSLAPRDFKFTIGRYAPMFSGYAQHDAQELLAFLLDGLHEDLNRIHKKPFVETKDADGRPDEVVAAEAWHNHRLRNDSVIVDHFQGQYKSTVECPECSRVSVTFDPFMYLSLPLPTSAKVTMPVLFVPADPDKPLTWLTLDLPSRWDAHTITSAVVEKMPGLDRTLLNPVLMSDHTVQTYTISYASLDADDLIVVYELGTPPRRWTEPGAKLVNVTVSLRHPDAQLLRYCGLPLQFTVPATATYRDVYHLTKRHLARTAADPAAFLALPDSEERPDDAMDVDDAEDAALERAYQQNEDTEAAGAEAAQGAARAPLSLFRLRAKYASSMSMPTSDDGPLDPANNDALVIDLPKDLFEAHFAATNSRFEARTAYAASGAKPSINLDQCIALFSKREQLGQDDAWYCSKCQKHQEAFKQLELYRLPEILVIHLKRFHYSTYSREKIDAFVDFPIAGLDLSGRAAGEKEPAVYDLFAVSNHYGGISGGHYTAYAKNQVDGKWYYFDDSSVSETSEESVKTQAAYMLMYRRRHT